MTTTRFRETITTLAELRSVVAGPHELALRKEIHALDDHCRAFIGRSPFLLLATSNAQGRCDVSPKGDAPGFVQLLGDNTLLLPDRPGNQRLDSLQNIIENPHAGLLFIIPGVEWTLRVNGRARIVRDDDLRERLAFQGRPPALVIVVDVEEAFLHCPKCFKRSQFWDTSCWMPAAEQPSFAAVIRDHTELGDIPVETIDKALEASNRKLY